MILSSGIKKVVLLNEEERKEIQVKNEFSSARLFRYKNNLDLAWIETSEYEQCKGHGTNILNHIVTNILQPHETLNIKVADESTLGFYFKWLQRMGFKNSFINDLITDVNDAGFKISLQASIFSKLPSSSSRLRSLRN